MAIVGLFCGSDATKRCKNAAVAFPLISDWLVWGGMQDARASLRCAMRAGAGSARRPSASARETSRRRRRAPQTGSATQPVPPGAVCAHGARRARPGSSSLRTNPVLLPLSVALGGLSGPSGVAREPRSAVHPPSAAAADLSGSRLFSSQAGSGTCPEGAAASSGAAPQGRPEADIGADAARERRKQAGKDVRKGRSLAEVGAAFFELRRAWGCRQRVCSSRCGKRPPNGCEGKASCCSRFSCCITPRTIRILPFLLRLHHRIIHSLHEHLSIKVH